MRKVEEWISGTKEMKFIKIIEFVILWFLVEVFIFVILFPQIIKSFKVLELLVLGLFFFFIDIFGLDGGAMYGIAKIFGGKGNFERHVSVITRWKLPLLVIQSLFLFLVVKGFPFSQILFISSLLIEICFFIVTFKVVHKISYFKSSLIIFLIFGFLAVLIHLPIFLNIQTLIMDYVFGL